MQFSVSYFFNPGRRWRDQVTSVDAHDKSLKKIDRYCKLQFKTQPKDSTSK